MLLLVPVPVLVAAVCRGSGSQLVLTTVTCAALLSLPVLLIYARLPAAAAVATLPLAGVAGIAGADATPALPGLLVLFGVAVIADEQ